MGSSLQSTLIPASESEEQNTLTGLLVGETYIVTIQPLAVIIPCIYATDGDFLVYGDKSEAVNFTTVALGKFDDVKANSGTIIGGERSEPLPSHLNVSFVCLCVCRSVCASWTGSILALNIDDFYRV